MANSASFLRHKNAKQYQSWRDKYFAARTHTEEAIRPGIMLYGADPLEQANSSSESLLAAMTLAAPVLAVRNIKAGEFVGYKRRWQAQRDSVIATVGIGYADGYPRHAANGTAVIIKGQRASLVGTVSMDTIGVDITDLFKQGIDVTAGDTAQLWGETLSANEVATNSGTIAYQLFTGVSERVKRIYL
jgi:alanine racemase